MSVPAALQSQQSQLRIATRALGRHGLAHAYGHCSVRLDAEGFLVCAPRPMGLIRPDESGVVVGAVARSMNEVIEGDAP